jgi:hypothetical protein
MRTKKHKEFNISFCQVCGKHIKRQQIFLDKNLEMMQISQENYPQGYFVLYYKLNFFWHKRNTKLRYG